MSRVILKNLRLGEAKNLPDIIITSSDARKVRQLKFLKKYCDFK
jgi:hypothetical protein